MWNLLSTTVGLISFINHRFLDITYRQEPKHAGISSIASWGISVIRLSQTLLFVCA